MGHNRSQSCGMSEALARYRELEDALIFARWLHRGMESHEEDCLLEEMDRVWWELDDAERCRLDAEPPRSLIRPGSKPHPHRVLADADKEAEPNAPPRRIVEAA